MLSVLAGGLLTAAAAAGLLHIVRGRRNGAPDRPSQLAARIRTPAPSHEEFVAALAEGKEWEYECIDDILRIAHERTSSLLGQVPEPLPRTVHASVFLQFALGLSRYLCALSQDVGGHHGNGALSRSRPRLLPSLAQEARELAPDGCAEGVLTGPGEWERALKHWDRGHALPRELHGSLYDTLVREIASRIEEQLPRASSSSGSSNAEAELRRALDQLNASSWIWELGEG